MTNKEAYEYFRAQGLSMGLAQRFANETTLYELWKAKVDAEAERDRLRAACAQKDQALEMAIAQLEADHDRRIASEMFGGEPDLITELESAAEGSRNTTAYYEFLRLVHDGKDLVPFLKKTDIGYGWAIELGLIRRVSPYLDFELTAAGLRAMKETDDG